MNAQEFERLKTSLLSLSAKQRAEVRAIVGTSEPKRSGETPRHEPEIWAPVATAMCHHNATHYVPFSQFKRARPFEAKQVDEVNSMVKAELPVLFPGANHLEQIALVKLIAVLAFNRLRENERPITLQNMLSALVPLTELFDDRYPGYRQGGVLRRIVLQHLNRTRKE